MTCLAPVPGQSFPSKSRGIGARPPRHLRTAQFRHITGEMTNPAVLENFVVEHPMVRSAIMFGHGRYSVGLLIELEDEQKIDTNDAKQVQETRNRLQPVIDRLNMFAPQHARVQKEMILFAAPTKPFIHSPTSSSFQVNRRDTLSSYSDEINSLYKTIARATRMTLKPPKVWSPQNSLVFVRGIIVAVLGKRLDDDADLFDYGIDSLQATRIRIMLFHALRSTAKADTRKLTGNILHQYRTISSLASFAARTALACFRHRTESNLVRCLEMTKRVEDYSRAFPAYHPEVPPRLNDVVLITGTTGLFGSNLLAEFLQSPRVVRVYALNRKKSRPGSVAERQASLLQASGLDPVLARHPKLILLEGDARRNNLGLSHHRHHELVSSVTHIVHNAWLSTYDHNSPLSVFDGSFCMLRNLVDFALSSPLPVPPRLVFISSTSVLRGTSLCPPKLASEQLKDDDGPEGAVGACDAAGDAYGESKWVGEQILAAAASETPLRPIIVRVGPLCGASNGRWREADPFPKIVQLGAALGSLPQVDEVVHWIPVHTAARAVVEMRNSLSTYLHVTHPHPISSLSLFHCIGEELHLPLIPHSQWTAKLEAKVHATHNPPSATASTSSPFTTPARTPQDPALTLLRHVQHVSDLTPTNVGAMTATATATTTTTTATTTTATSTKSDSAPARIFRHVQITSDLPRLRGDMAALGIDDVRLWLRHWHEMGAIPPAEDNPSFEPSLALSSSDSLSTSSLSCYSSS